jgi:rfaE bifunctional protein nucleotidyltransferase chain/domain
MSETSSACLLLEHDTIASTMNTLRDAGHRIVTTNGCFDLLHVGHVRYLQASKALGDVLIVALNSDASVKAFKGDKRPIVPQAERAEMLLALSCVDYVVIFDAPTPVETLQRIQPHVHTKGGQYTLETLPEYPALHAMGCNIQFIQMVEGRSTSSLIERIQDVYSPVTQERERVI